MGKTIVQFLLAVALLLSAWMALSRVGWIRLLHLDRLQQETVGELNDVLWKTIAASQVVVEDSTLLLPLEALVDKICEANGLDRSRVKLHLVDSREVNACALPGGHLVVFSALIMDCRCPEELYGVVAHEVAHLQQGHVTKKLIKEFGTTVLVSASGGKADLPLLKEMIGTLTGSAYDRSLEQEADLVAVGYMNTSGVDPLYFADFMERMADKDAGVLSWMASHPDSKERAEYIRSKRVRPMNPVVLSSDSTWKAWRNVIGSIDINDR